MTSCCKRAPVADPAGAQHAQLCGGRGATLLGPAWLAPCLFGLTAIPVVIVMTLGILYFEKGFLPSAQALLSGLAASAAGTSFGTALSTGSNTFANRSSYCSPRCVHHVGILRWSMIRLRWALRRAPSSSTGRVSMRRNTLESLVSVFVMFPADFAHGTGRRPRRRPPNWHRQA